MVKAFRDKLEAQVDIETRAPSIGSERFASLLCLNNKSKRFWVVKQFQNWMRRPLAYPLGRQTRARLVSDAGREAGLQLFCKTLPNRVV